jgi:hypothetical protein
MKRGCVREKGYNMHRNSLKIVSLLNCLMLLQLHPELTTCPIAALHPTSNLEEAIA